MAFVRSSIREVDQSRTKDYPHSFDAVPLPKIGQTGLATYETANAGEFETSVIGSDLTILGDKITIISQNRLQIDGEIQGDVTGKQVTIGTGGSVTGTVSAERIEVHGGVHGAIRARSVALHPSSLVDGEIVHESLSISEGAQFDGRVRRAKDVNELTPKLDPKSYPAHTSNDTSAGT